MEKYNLGRKKIDENLKPEIIGDIQGVYGVDKLNPYFLYLLSLRGILRGLDNEREIILPSANRNIQKSLLKVKKDLLKILDLKEKQVKVGDFKLLSSSKNREPYMRTIYYFDNNYIKNNKKILELVRYLGDKAGLANFMLKNNFDNLLPNNTKVFLSWDNLLAEVKNRFNNKNSFVVKAGEGASGENMILVRFTSSKAYLYYALSDNSVSVESWKEFLSHLNKAIPLSSRIKKGTFDEKGYNKNNTTSQLFLVQDLINTEIYNEKSINFYITLNGEIFPVTYGKNIATGGIHKGNIEEILPDFVYQKLSSLLVKMFDNGYYGPIGFDMFVDYNLKDLRIIEANTRYTAPITPSMLVYKLQKKGKIPSNYTWKSIQKFDTLIDLTSIGNLKKYNLIELLLKDKDINGACFVCYSPVFGGRYQSVIIIGPSQESILELETIIKKNLNYNFS